MKWQELIESRQGLFNHPAANQVIEEAWGQFTQSNRADHDLFAGWLVSEKNWPVFVSRFEKLSGIELSADFKRNPTAKAVVVTASVPSVVMPWNVPAPRWAPARLFHHVTESAWHDVLVRAYDILSNIIGLPIFAGQLGAIGLHIGHYAIFTIGAVAISFIEVLALRARARAIEIAEQPPSSDRYIRSLQNFAKHLFNVFAFVGMLMFVLDIYLSILPWAMLFNWNIIGWIIGLVLSLYVEYVEIDTHLKAIKAMEQGA